MVDEQYTYDCVIKTNETNAAYSQQSSYAWYFCPLIPPKSSLLTHYLEGINLPFYEEETTGQDSDQPSCSVRLSSGFKLCLTELQAYLAMACLHYDVLIMIHVEMYAFVAYNIQFISDNTSLMQNIHNEKLCFIVRDDFLYNNN
jgi:hypothetical protein